jgi:hypothetical protein
MADEGLLQSIERISYNNNVVYKALEQKLSEPINHASAAIWQPKALLIKEKSDWLFDYLQFTINTLKKNAGSKFVNGIETFQQGSINAVSQTLQGENSPEKIVAKLHQYKTEVLSVDPELSEQFSKSIAVVSGQLQADANGNTEVTFFKDIPVFAAIVLLHRFQSNIKNIESQMISFCLNKIPSYRDCGYEVFQALVGQSSTIVKSGEKITIQAGIGAFSVASNPVITIDGKKLKPDTYKGFVEYTFGVPANAGKYSKEVAIEYTETDGRKQKTYCTIKYEVKN